MPKLTPLEPASTVISLCGGFKQVAKLLDRDETRVRRWTYPVSSGGTGGLIPSNMQVRLLVWARENGVALTPEHFFPKHEGVGHRSRSGRGVRKAQESQATNAGEAV